MLISTFSLNSLYQDDNHNMVYTEFGMEEDPSMQKLDSLVKKASSTLERIEALNLSRRSSRDHSVNPHQRTEFSFSQHPSTQKEPLQLTPVPLGRENSLLATDQYAELHRDNSLMREKSVNAELRLWHEMSVHRDSHNSQHHNMPFHLAGKLMPGRSEEDGVSNSTADSKPLQGQLGKLNLIQLVTRMGNENALNITDYNGVFGLEEKTLIANLIFIKCPKSEIAPTLDTENFIKQVNKVLRDKKDKRKDDQLRFVYKKAIRNMLSNATEYAPSKSAKMEDYTDRFLKFYFPEKTDRNKDVLDTSYASVKRIKTYFHDSPMFKQHFLDTCLKVVVKEYVRYTEETYTKMHEVMTEHMRASTDDQKYRVDVLRTRYKRIPWSCLDIIDSINLIKGSCLGGQSS